jgi:hypothetical protein
MVIIFMNEKARNQLLNKGVVYTLRHIRHIEGIDWMTDKRGNKKICDVRITYINDGTFNKIVCLLRFYVSQSGFNSVEEWINIFKDMNSYSYVWLYQVERWVK